MRQFFRRVSYGGRVWVILLLAVGAALLGARGAGAGGQAGYGCAPGFDLGGLTLAPYVALPRNQAGLTAGAFDSAALAAGFNAVDHNGNGVVCVKDNGALNGGVSFWQYTYNIADDNASPAAGS